MTARHALLVKRCRKYAGLLLLLAAFSAAAETAGERRWIITMTWLPQAQFAGVYYAKEAGIFEKYGLSPCGGGASCPSYRRARSGKAEGGFSCGAQTGISRPQRF